MKKKYLLSGLIVFLIIMVTYFIKNIYPFGNDFIAWGDMHAQVLALYYNFYDVIYNGKSHFIDFTSGVASNIYANFAYYITSPFTLIVLLFKRVNIPQAVSIIVMLKFIISAITCNYVLDKRFKKLSDFYKIIFSVLYAISTYNLSLYIIIGWLDVVYLFPLLFDSLIDLFDSKKAKKYIILLSLSFIFNFYITIICTLFIFFFSFIYLKKYKKNEVKEKLVLLGISTVLSLMISSIVLIPSYKQILNSSRMGVNFDGLLNSKTGPIIDKFMFLTSSALLFVCNIFLLKKSKNKKFKIMYLSSLLIITPQLVIEPINKLWHLGSYVYYPYRYGFILMFLLILGSCYYLENKSSSDTEEKNNKYANILITMIVILLNVLIVFLIHRYYPMLQNSINKLTFSLNKKAFIIIAVVSFINFITYFLVMKFIHKENLLKKGLILLSVVVFSISFSLLYIKIDSDEKLLHSKYDDMNYIYDYEFEDGYHVKKDYNSLIENFGFVTNKSTQEFFTSLTNNDMFVLYQKLGYDSYAMNTSSNGSNIFIDGIMGNRYLVSEKDLDDNYYSLMDSTENIKIYDTKLDLSKGYIINKNVNLDGIKNSFEASNVIYRSISGKTDNIFNIINIFDKVNVDYSNNTLRKIDKTKEAYLEKNVNVLDEQILYFEFTKPFINKMNNKTYSAFKILVNDETIYDSYLSKENTGSVNLGTFKDEVVNVKIVLLKDNIPNINGISIGMLSVSQLDEFFKENKIDLDYRINKDSISINYISNKEGILFLPIGYIDGMYVTNNGKKTDIVKVFDNFVGINLLNGENNIDICYTPKYFNIGCIMSIIGIILSVLFIKFKDKILSLKIIKNVSYYLYIILFLIMVLSIYIVPAIMFVLSFI